jgi:hypothetical protein
MRNSRSGFIGSGVFALVVALASSCGGGTEERDSGSGVGSDGGHSAVVGQSCLPESVPRDGFEPAEVYLETTSDACATGDRPGVCIVYQLDGDPRTTDCPDCPNAAEVEARVFCTCRCSSVTGPPPCACPDGFMCVDNLVTTGGDGVRGGYCVREGL